MLIPFVSYIPVLRRLVWSVAVVLSVSLVGCRSPQAPPPPNQTSNSTRDDAYSLLYDLLTDEQNVDKLLLLKNETAEVGELIVDIAQFCQDTAEDLKQYAASDPTLSLQRGSLPTAELKTRDSIGSARAKRLLLSKGQNFELQLLLTQHEALSYGAHLARVAREADKDAHRRLRMEQVMQKLQALNERVFQLLLNRMKSK